MLSATAADPDPGLLDDPVWQALTGPHRRFAIPAGRPAHAYRYPAEVAPFAALHDASDPAAWRELGELCGPDGRVALEAAGVVAVPQGWEVATVFPIAQMIAPA